jgi:uncharacterized delta-60 repeat protein
MPDGTLDPTWGSDGFVEAHFVRDDASYATELVLLPDGKVIVGGTTSPVRVFSGGADYSGPSHAAVMQLSPTGEVDTTFGAGGSAVFTFTNWTSLGVELARSPAGGILIGTGLTATVIENNGPSSGFAIIRLRADGTADPTFGQGGRVAYLSSSDVVARLESVGARALAVDNSGRILFVRRFSDPDGGRAGVWRLLPNGSLDASFGNGLGKVEIPTNVASGANVVRSPAARCCWADSPT